MARYIILIIFFVIVMGIEIFRQKSFLSATVIYPVTWIFAIAAVILSVDRYWIVGYGTLCVIGIGYVLFCLGYELTIKRLNTKSKKGKARNIKAAYWHYWCIAGISMMIGVAYAMVIIPSIDITNLAMSWVSIRDNVLLGNMTIPYVLTVARYFNRVAIWFVTLKVVYTEDIRQKKICIICLTIILASALIASFVDFSRNDMLFTILPVLFLVLMKQPMNNKRTCIIVGISFLAFCLFFGWFTQYRGAEYVGTEISVKFKVDSFREYLGDSIPGLNSNIQNGTIKIVTTEGRGKYTLSGIYGLIGKIWGSTEAPQVVQEQTQVGVESYSNVFTIYHWTGRDFGIIYALFWQLILGGVYGVLYYYSTRKNEYAILGYSILSYPLVMMFFQDQFFSIGQSWIILIGFGVMIWIITRIGSGKYADYGSNGNL